LENDISLQKGNLVYENLTFRRERERENTLVDEKNKPLSETITDAQIANLLGEHGLEADAENIDLVRSSRKMVEKYLEQYDKGRPFGEILTEIQINSLRKN